MSTPLTKAPREDYQMDAVDIHILTCLQRDSHTRYKELSYDLNRSQSVLHKRVKRLESLGYIRKYVAIMDHAKVKGCLISFLQVSLNEQSSESRENFMLQLMENPRVLECYQTTGEFDFLLKIFSVSMAQYNEFLIKEISTIQNVGKKVTTVALSELKNETQIPL